MARRERFRTIGAIAALAAVGCTAVAWRLSPASSSAAARRTESIVALGDSVPSGTACRCTPYPALTAKELTTGTRTFVATDDAVGGYTTGDVLRQLTSDGAVIDQVRAADVVEIEIGANDVSHTTACGTVLSCYQPRLPAMGKNLAAIVRRTRTLAGRHVLVVLLDYWNVWLGGKYEAARGPAYVATADALTDEVDRMIRSTAAETGSAYVDLRAAFKGPNYAFDETHYLASDGDHPNAAGHRQIAAATGKVIARDLRLSSR